MTAIIVTIAGLATVMVLFAIIALVLLAVEHVVDNGIEPRFPCAECEHFEGNRCKKCVDGVSGKPRPCAFVRGTLKCLAGARRAK